MPVVRKPYRSPVRSVGRSAFGLSLRAQVIQSLFGSGQQGVMIDPSDLSTLWKDVAGTDPVTADGNLIGLVFDHSQQLSVGNDLVTNGSFDTDSDWTKGSNWTISGGVATSTGVNTPSNSDRELRQSLVLSANRFYRVAFEIPDGDARTGDLFIRANEKLGDNLAVLDSETVYPVSFDPVYFAEHTDLVFSTSAAPGGDEPFDLDNVSIRELAGFHARQVDTAKKPKYRTDGTLHSIEHDLTDDALVVTLPDFGTNATVKYVTSGGITTLTNQTISGGFTLPQATWYGVIVYEGPMTTEQSDLADKWLNEKAGL